MPPIQPSRWHTHSIQQQTQHPLPTLGPFPAHPEVSPPACQVHLPWKERRRRGVLGAAPTSTATQSRARPGIMAAASARPIPAAQGAQGSAGVCGGALSHPGLCPGSGREGAAARAREGGWGESPGIRLQPLGERGWGVAFHLQVLLSLGGCPAWPQSQTHPRWAHHRGQPHTGRRLPHHVTLPSNPPSCTHTHRH